MFQKTLFTEHLRVIAHANSSVPTKVLSTDHTLFVFLSFFLVITDNCSYGSLFRKCIKIKILLFTRIYSKINMNVAKTILRQQ